MHEMISANKVERFCVFVDQAEDPERKVEPVSGQLLLGLGQPVGAGAQASRHSGSSPTRPPPQ
jgi:hypothetical protein